MTAVEEFADQLKAGAALVEKLTSLPSATTYVNARTTEIAATARM